MTTIRFPIRLLTLVCLLTIVAFVWFGWILFDISLDAKFFLDKGSRIEELRGVLVHLDEVLTMSARMAAATGDSQWEEHYRQFEPQLDAAIKETEGIETNPSNLDAAIKAEEANIKLVEMENRAFALVRAGRKEEAQAVLFNPEYETQKKIYLEKITSFVVQIRRELDESLRDEHRVDLLSIVAALVIGGTSLVAWWSAARGVRGWRVQLLESFHRRAEAEENLREAHAKLETRVKERTADLAKTNETLQAEISERKRAEWQLNIQYAISRILTESSTLKEASARILQTVCENLNWQVGEFYRMDRRAEVLRFDDLWSAPDPQMDAFITLSQQTTFARGIGLPGRVWASGKPIWIPDVVVDENFPRAAAAKQVGLHGAFCFPILSGNEVIGVIDFFSHEIRQPDEELLRVFAVLGSQLGQFFERKRSEETLRESEEKFRQLADHITDVFWMTSPDLKTMYYVSGGYEVIWGRSSESLYAHPHQWIEVILEEDRERVVAVFGTLMRKQSKVDVEYRIVRPDGTIRWVQDRGFQVLDEAGQVVRLAGIATDITERKRGEAALQRSEAHTKAIVESSLDCILTIDHMGKILEFNPAAEKIFGYSRAKVLGMELAEVIIPPSLRERHRLGMRRYLATGEAKVLGKRIEMVAMRSDGSEFPVELTITRLGTDDPPMFTGFIRDITERKAAEEALRQAEEKYRGIFENAVDGIFQTTPEGRFFTANHALARMLGFESPEELMAERTDIAHEHYVDPNRREEFKRLLEENGTLRDFELEAYRKDGSRIWLSENVLAVGDDNGTVIYYEGTTHDITKRKGAEEALRASEETYRSLFEGNPNPMWVFDSETLYFLAVNDAAVRHYGYSREEFLTMTLKDIRPPEDIPVLEKLLSGASDAMNSSVRCRHRRKDGALMDIELTSHVLTWGGRRARLVLISDVTERDRAEARVREQADIINRAHDAIIIVNFEDQGVAFWNSGAERLYGWSADEAMGRSIGELIFADAKDYDGPQQLLASIGEFHGEIKQVAKDGREIIVDSRATLIRNPDGTPRSGLLINTDVTEQKKLETHLLRSQRLESIGTLASGVAHDLNNILTPILMCAEVLKGNPMQEDFPALVSLIEESAKRGANVVKQVLTFARGIEGERVVIKPSHLIQEMIDIAKNTFPKTIEIIGRYTDDLWSINCDPTQLHQVLLNLSVNARDAMPNGGTITIGAENFDVDEHYASMSLGAKPGPHLMFRVTDTGTGMSRATIDKIFDPFFTTKQIGKGTGLGLSTAVGIVKSHGGFISVYSELGTGTTFKVLLPAQVGEGSSRKSAASPESLNGNGELVLVVDDEVGILRITKMILENHNYRVLPVNDGTEALAAFAQEMDSIKVVLTDIMMPYLDGVALIRAIKKMKPEMVFIASTGQGEETRVAELQSLNVGNFLTKPYDTARLLKILRDTLGGAPSNGNGSFLKHQADNSKLTTCSLVDGL